MNYGTFINYEQQGNTITLHFSEKDVYVQIMNDKILRFTTDLTHKSYAVVMKPEETIAYQINKSDSGVEILLNNTDIKVLIEEDFSTTIYEQGKVVCKDYQGVRKEADELSEEQLHFLNMEGHKAPSKEEEAQKVTIIKSLAKGDAIYGLGDKPGNLNKRGYSYVNWNTDNPDPHVDNFQSLYKSIPFFMVLNDDYCYGIFADNTFKTTFDFGKEKENYYFLEHVKGELDYYYIAGGTPANVVSNYVDLTGHAKVPQKWLFGYHQSRWSYFSENEVKGLADNFKKYDIPCDCIHLDIDYMDGYRVFTFDKEKFANPEKLTKDLQEQGIKIITIVDPGVKKDENYKVYQEGIEKSAFAKDQEGQVYVNEVWPGDSVFPDFTSEKVRQWWGDNISTMVKAGVRGIWNDMNEPASFRGPLPDDVQFERGKHEEIHNVYGHLMAQATYEGLLRYDKNRRPFVLTRACYGGSQRYCGGWTGDNHSIWPHIRLSIEQMCNLGLSGMMMSGSDIGGFGSDTTPELMARFFEAAVFSPFFRSHSAMGTKRQEPWEFDEETVGIIRKMIKLRYHFLPYIYDLAHECEKTGAPILRPLVYEYPKDANVRNITDQYMLGKQMIVAPVLEAGAEARAVYLPEGDWYDYNTKELIKGGGYILAHAKIDVLPIYVKAGAVIPVTMKEVSHVEEIRPENVGLLLYPGEGEVIHYEDDGESLDYENGAYKAVRYEQKADGELVATVLQDGYSACEPKKIPVQ